MTVFSKVDRLKVVIKAETTARGKLDVMVYTKIEARLLTNESMTRLSILAAAMWNLLGRSATI
ncbi:MAG: hypothetical protein ABSF24_03410 [Candidatus Bathyarchaeia archaeon]|jgi:hypothetical protein